MKNDKQLNVPMSKPVDIDKVVFRGKCMALNAFIKKIKKSASKLNF
jgi:hypothetical protein